MGPSYFLISVSNRQNLDLCMKHGLAGFTNSLSGVWTYLELQEGDFISFLYGARAHNLYQVVRREALENAGTLPPWKPITFKQSGRTYYFPFRVSLKPVRSFNEPLVRAEFAYVAENLLLRGGYRKTHFQADQTTLQNASQMGIPSDAHIEHLSMPRYRTFVPMFTRQTKQAVNPKVYLFSELSLQAAIRQHLLDGNGLVRFLEMMAVRSLTGDQLEVLSEKALPEGHVDILLKERVPIGKAMTIPIEVKLRQAQVDDVVQVRGYMDEFGNECLLGILVAEKFGKKVAEVARTLGVALVRYSVPLDWDIPRGFDEILVSLRFDAV